MITKTKPKIAKRRAANRPNDLVDKPKPKSIFMRNDFASPVLMGWQPALREASHDVRRSWVHAVARTLDTMHNSGWIAGAVEQAIAMNIGTGLRLTAKPDMDALGWTPEQAKEWSRTVERRWEAYSNEAMEVDITGKSNIGKLAASAFRTWFGYGEILFALPYVVNPGAQYGTKCQLLPPSRLRQDTILGYRQEQNNIVNLIQGVFCNVQGFPMGYRLDQPPDSLSMPLWRDVPARDMWNRPQFVHIFDGYPGQMRGIPPLTPALRVVRQFDQLADATLTSALIQAIFTATITSPSPTQEVLQSFQDTVEQKLKPGSIPPSPLEAMFGFRQGFYEGTQIDLGSHGKISHLAPGDELKFERSEHPNATYDMFVKILLREMARCIGVTFEQLTGDYVGATYSSVRMATAEIWMINIYRRINIVAPFYQFMYQAWMEEEIDKGWLVFPGGIDGFNANRAAACRAHWRGPAKPQADDQKFAKAVETLRNMGVVTDEWICGEMGEDWLDVYEQRALEMAERKRLGLPEVVKVPLNDPDDIQNAEAAIEVADAAPEPTPAPAKKVTK